MLVDPKFDVLAWHSAYQSCQQYFLDHAQHNPIVQAVAAFINICLPLQLTTNPASSNSGHSSHMTMPYSPSHPCWGSASSSNRIGPLKWVSLVPYIRRLVATGFDEERVLHSFFGDNWRKGIGQLHDHERRNYLFAAKSVGWAKAKYQYDMSPHETVPFLKPLQNVQVSEIEGAEEVWSQWLAMEDWMVGPRAPKLVDEGSK